MSFNVQTTFPIRPCFSYSCSLPRSRKMRSSVWSSNSRLTSEACHALLLGWDDWLYRLSCAYQPHCQRWDDETKNVTCEPTYRCCCTDSSRFFAIKITAGMKGIERRVSSIEFNNFIEHQRALFLFYHCHSSKRIREKVTDQIIPTCEKSKIYRIYSINTLIDIIFS